MTDAGLGAAMDIRFGASVPEFLEYITDLGLDHVELKREYLQGHPEAPSPERMGELADDYGVSVTYHAPFRDWNLGSFNDASRRASAAQVKATIDDAATAGAGAVVVHGGSVPRRYPEWVREQARENALRSLAECAEYAQLVGVPMCLENQPRNASKRRYTETPDELAAVLAEVDVTPEYFGVTLDVGHAKVNGVDWGAFVDRFGDRIRVCHLHDNDGTADQHEPLVDHESVVEHVPADYFVFETKSVPDVARSVGAEPLTPDTELTSDV
ncbi:sugar phosphate isomerase/epimerase family protein [Haloarcula laminariae]|uniref:sugar phosphate isomerase/epimerase family protein n=1 Tax=Haloarcula laminariae TaxID=2961577 RepID=UPI0021CAAEFC|nr:sugar phosphate isomerase/epimerase family protein [Halomicroarcula laminariae]